MLDRYVGAERFLAEIKAVLRRGAYARPTLIQSINDAEGGVREGELGHKCGTSGHMTLCLFEKKIIKKVVRKPWTRYLAIACFLLRGRGCYNKA